MADLTDDASGSQAPPVQSSDGVISDSGPGSGATAARPSSVPHGPTLAVGGLWVFALLVTAVLMHQRYRGAIAGNNGGDFRIYLHSAHLMAAGHSPYPANGKYFYPPTIALVLVPFVQIATIQVFKAWTILEMAALIVGAAAFVAIQWSKLRSWLRPVLFVICIATAFHFWPTTIGLSLGQADAFVFAALMLSAWAASREWPATRGALIGIAGLLKAWPAAVVVSLFQRGSQRRLREVTAFVITVLVAPVLALLFGGGSGLVAFVRSVLTSRSQHLVSDSVWGAPRLLFSNSGLARPLVTSMSLQVLTTAVLLIWVVGLLAIALGTPGDKVMCTWNVTFCIVLLLPVSHLAYTLYGLPLLWLWVSYLLASRRFTWQQLAVPVVLFLWWAVLNKAWPDDGSSAAIGSIHYCVVFVVDLLACTASVIGTRMLHSSPSTEVGGPVSSVEVQPDPSDHPHLLSQGS